MLLLLPDAAQIVCAVAAVLLARRRVDHRPFAIFVVLMVLVNLVRAARAVMMPVRALDALPYEGWARVGFHLEEALFLTWPAGLVAVVLVVFVSPRWMAILPGVVWAALVGYLATHYPAVRGETLRGVYLAAELAALAVAAGAIITWTWRRASPTPAHACVLFVALIDAVALLGGALRHGFEHWYLDQICNVAMYVLLTFYQGRTLWLSHYASR